MYLMIIHMLRNLFVLSILSEIVHISIQEVKEHVMDRWEYHKLAAMWCQAYICIDLFSTLSYGDNNCKDTTDKARGKVGGK